MEFKPGSEKINYLNHSFPTDIRILFRCLAKISALISAGDFLFSVSIPGEAPNQRRQPVQVVSV